LAGADGNHQNDWSYNRVAEALAAAIAEMQTRNA